MEKDFWLQRWQQGKIGFHRDAPMPLLVQHWPSLGIAPGTRVLVPLCGKTLDMAWFAAQGFRVLGVELSPLAIAQFFDEQRLQAAVHESPLGRHHVAGAIEIIEGDAFGLDDATLATCHAIYDRAAIIALPAELRTRHVERIYKRLPHAARGLVITLEYDQAEMDGPPFSVDAGELDALFGRELAVECIERRDILDDGFRGDGLSAIATGVYRIDRR